MSRVKTNLYYLLIFLGVSIFGYAIVIAVQLVSGFIIPGNGLIIAALAALVAGSQFKQFEARKAHASERSRLIHYSLLITIILNIVLIIAAAASGVFTQLTVLAPDINPVIWGALAGFVIAIYSALQYVAIRIGYKNIKIKKGETVTSSGKTFFDDIAGPSEEAQPVTSAAAQKPADDNDGWQPVNEARLHAMRDERAPWGRWVMSGIAIAAIGFGAIWLASKVVVPKDIPVDIVSEEITPDDEPQPQPVDKELTDDEAWVRALEKDTLEGYREYLAAFPQGRHKDDAQARIDAYDNADWATAEQRDTIAGYEDYLESWPEGLHAAKAKERIAQIKAAAEARRKDAEERARQDEADWENAARNNTVPSYEGYLSKHPTGKYEAEARTRIAALNATAADNAAWEAAKAVNRADSYQQYLTSFPQGAHVPKAIAALEQLTPKIGREFQDCASCPTMVTLASGNAQLGAGDNETDARPNEKPRRPVTISNMFAIGVTEVTFAEYDACVAAGGCSGRPSDNGWGRGSRPVINVSWDDAQKYVTWLSSTSGQSYSLPSEAQWEYAARAGDSGVYAGGSLAAICAFANGAAQESGLRWANSACSDLSSDRTLPAGNLSKNKFGLRDMIGNVGEWTLDCNTLNLRDAPTDGSADQRGSCNQRVVRGGSWFSGPADLRYASRLMQRRGDSNDFTGFRVVRKISN